MLEQFLLLAVLGCLAVIIYILALSSSNSNANKNTLATDKAWEDKEQLRIRLAKEARETSIQEARERPEAEARRKQDEKTKSDQARAQALEDTRRLEEDKNRKKVAELKNSSPLYAIKNEQAYFVKKRETIMTVREIECFELMREEMGDEFVIFTQVAFSQLLKAEGGSEEKRLWLWRRMAQKVADYVVCRKDYTVIAIVELDDWSHFGKNEKDSERDAVIESIGLKALRLRGPAKKDSVKRIADEIRRFQAEKERREAEPA